MFGVNRASSKRNFSFNTSSIVFISRVPVALKRRTLILFQRWTNPRIISNYLSYGLHRCKDGKENKTMQQTFISWARSSKAGTHSSYCWAENTFEPDLIMPLFCHAIFRNVLPSSWVWSNPSVAMPTVFVLLQ